MSKPDESKAKETETTRMVEEAEVVAAELAALRRRMRNRAVDDASASYQGGAGAQGGQVDFGNPGNFAKPDY